MDDQSQSTRAPISLRSRIGTIALGHTVNKLWDWVFDYALYPFVIYNCGLVWGFATMAVLSFVVCWLLMLFYDWSKRDWLGIEAIKELKHYDGNSRYARWISWVMRRSDPVACVLLSIQFDPFIATVYLRRGRYGGMGREDWRNFLLSWLIGNAYWSIVCFGGVSALIWFWGHVKSLM